MGNHWLNKAEVAEQLSLEEVWLNLLAKMEQVKPSGYAPATTKRLDYTALDRKLMEQACSNGGSASIGWKAEEFNKCPRYSSEVFQRICEVAKEIGETNE